MHTLDSQAELVGLFPKLIEVVHLSGTFFQQGKDEEAFQSVVSIVDALQTCLTLVNRVGGEIPEAAKRGLEIHNEMIQLLNHLLTAWQKKDYVLVADCLLFAILPHLEKDQKWLSTLARRH